MVFIVDDDAGIRNALARLVRSAGWKAATFASPQELLDLPFLECPGCIVLDVCLPGLSGLELQRELASRNIGTPIIFLTGHGDIPMSVRAMKSGAMDFLTKPFAEHDLLKAVEDALRKDHERQAEAAELKTLQNRYQSMTPREREVMGLVIKGLMNKEIAAELSLSEKTVKVHRGRVMHKMQFVSVAELVRAASRLRLGKEPASTTKV